MIISYPGLLSQASLICSVLGWNLDVCSFLSFCTWGKAFLWTIFLEVTSWQFVPSEPCYCGQELQKRFPILASCFCSYFLCFSELVTVKACHVGSLGLFCNGWFWMDLPLSGSFSTVLVSTVWKFRVKSVNWVHLSTRVHILIQLRTHQPKSGSSQ